MKPKFREILDQAIESGIKYGWYKAHKHTDEPGESDIKGAIATAIWLEIDSLFDFEQEGEP